MQESVQNIKQVIDIASGFNFERKGFKTILGFAMSGTPSRSWGYLHRLESAKVWGSHSSQRGGFSGSYIHGGGTFFSPGGDKHIL